MVKYEGNSVRASAELDAQGTANHRSRVEKMSFNKLLCVCTGNICRSPLAEGLLRKSLPHATVSSAGIAAVEGGDMPVEAKFIASRNNLGLSNHRGRQISAPIVRDSDLIFVMEKGQLDWITSRYPEAKGRVFLTTHWVDGVDVDDPYRRGQEYFERVYKEIEAGIQSWAAKIAQTR